MTVRQQPKDEISKMKESLEKWKKKHESVLNFMTRTSRRLDNVMEKITSTVGPSKVDPSEEWLKEFKEVQQRVSSQVTLETVKDKADRIESHRGYIPRTVTGPDAPGGHPATRGGSELPTELLTLAQFQSDPSSGAPWVAS